MTSHILAGSSSDPTTHNLLLWFSASRPDYSSIGKEHYFVELITDNYIVMFHTLTNFYLLAAGKSSNRIEGKLLHCNFCITNLAHLNKPDGDHVLVSGWDASGHAVHGFFLTPS